MEGFPTITTFGSMRNAPCAVCGSPEIPSGVHAGKQPWQTGGWVRVWSDIDDHTPVHVVCERRAPLKRGLRWRLFYRGPKRRWSDTLDG